MRYLDRLVRRRYVFESAVLLVSVALISGCAGGGSASSAWQAPKPYPVFSRILIVGVSTDINQRCDFEYAMASQFSGTQTKGIASCDSMTSKDLLTRANIERVVAAVGANAVLTVAVANVQVSSHKSEPVAYWQVTGVGYVVSPVGAYGVPVAFVDLKTTTPLPTVTGEVHLMTKLYDAKDASLVYSLDTQSKANASQSTTTTMLALSGQIGDRLHRDGVIN
jgi:hypothetical protein